MHEALPCSVCIFASVARLQFWCCLRSRGAWAQCWRWSLSQQGAQQPCTSSRPRQWRKLPAQRCRGWWVLPARPSAPSGLSGGANCTSLACWTTNVLFAPTTIVISGPWGFEQGASTVAASCMVPIVQAHASDFRVLKGPPVLLRQAAELLQLPSAQNSVQQDTCHCFCGVCAGPLLGRPWRGSALPRMSASLIRLACPLRVPKPIWKASTGTLHSLDAPCIAAPCAHLLAVPQITVGLSTLPTITLQFTSLDRPEALPMPHSCRCTSSHKGGVRRHWAVGTSACWHCVRWGQFARMAAALWLIQQAVAVVPAGAQCTSASWHCMHWGASLSARD